MMKMTSRKDYYSILGVSKSDSDDEIKQAYRRLASKLHPDKVAGEKEKKVAEEKFKDVKEAYEILSDASRRQRHDNESDLFRRASFNADYTDWTTSGSSTSMDDVIKAYENLFRRKSSESSFNNENRVITLEVKVTVKEAFNGADKLVRVPHISNSSIKISIPPGIQHGKQITTIHHGSQTFAFFADLSGDTTCDIDLGNNDIAAKGNIYTDFYVSPFKMICGGFAEYECIDGTVVQVRIPEGLEANKLLKIKERGYWKSEKREYRGDCFLRVIPAIMKLGDYPSDEVKLLIDRYSEILDGKQDS